MKDLNMEMTMNDLDMTVFVPPQENFQMKMKTHPEGDNTGHLEIHLKMHPHQNTPTMYTFRMHATMDLQRNAPTVYTLRIHVSKMHETIFTRTYVIPVENITMIIPLQFK